jgi:RimJ/RimL family protein N-acetyltransferase
MTIDFAGGIIRPWLATDAAALARLADNRAVWRNLRDGFPSPYSKKDARAWIRGVTRTVPYAHFAILAGGGAVVRPEAGGADGAGGGRSGLVVAGGIGLILQADIHAGSAEIGYWLGEPYWGRGIMSAALAAFTSFAFAEFRLRRLYALVLEWNPASMRVLEKCGYAREGRLRKSALKDGAVADEILFAQVL